MLGLNLIYLLLEFFNLFIKILGHCLLMVTEPSNLSITIIVKLDTLIDRHCGDCGRVYSMLISFEELV
jgi:hypothetical protein